MKALRAERQHELRVAQAQGLTQRHQRQPDTRLVPLPPQPAANFFPTTPSWISQIEHHLFPNICHVHYRKISAIVRETAFEYNLPYYSYKTFAEALGGHAKMLYNLGRYEDAPAIH